MCADGIALLALNTASGLPLLNTYQVHFMRCGERSVEGETSEDMGRLDLS